jgi:hypothetical protein
MNDASGLGAFGSGAISIRVEIADERICSVRIESSRPTGLPRLFLGRPAREAPILAGRLFALCGRAHGIASAAAIAAARGERWTFDPESRAGLLAERISESLRSSAAMTDDASAARLLRETLAMTRDYAGAATAQERNAHATRLREAAAALGLRDDRDALERSSLFGRLSRECESAPQLAIAPPDALGAEDDADVLDGMRREGERFSAEPRLPGRAPETGPFARRWREAGLCGGALPARLRARMIDLASCLERLEPDSGEGGDVRSACGAEREGFSAVETARGALYHRARLTAEGVIADYAILAPTEWNFHPAGPFVAALLGARVPPRGAEAVVGRLAALLDPCVAFRVEAQEAVHA